MNGNLKPFEAGRDAQENGRKGGLASAKARREKRAMRNSARLILAMPLQDGETADLEDVNLAIANGINLTVEEASLIAAARKALDGDYKALEFLRDTAGEKPTDRLELSADLAKASADIERRIQAMKQRKAKE